VHPAVTLLTNGVEMDVLGIAYSESSDADREAIVAEYPQPALPFAVRGRTVLLSVGLEVADEICWNT
jgi:hypothetical protein